MKNRLKQYRQQHDRRFLDELQALVRFPSVSTQPAHRRDLLACATWLRDHLRQIGLQSRLIPTRGNPILLAKSTSSPRRTAKADPPRVLIYGHYDVQPPDPLDEWRTPAFGAVVRGGRLYGRGASDNKGQFFAHVKAVESFLQSATPLPARVVFLIEGEEEVGSHSLLEYVKRHGRELRADYVVISDSGMFAKGQPSITYGTRGVVGLEVRVSGPSRDLHSGVFGGSVANPAQALAQLLASCVDRRGRVTVPGFYDDVRPLARWERREFARLPWDDARYARFLGVPRLAGERGYSTPERRWARPTFEINGLTSGYQGPGGKTIIPASATAKITCRLVPDQNPRKIAWLVTRHLRDQCSGAVRLTVEEQHHARPFWEPPSGPGIRCAARALERAFGGRTHFIREGGTLPILTELQRRLGGEIILAGLGLPDDNWHSPNEKMDLANFRGGIAMSCELLQELGKLSR